MPPPTWPAKKSIMFWMVSEPTSVNWNAGPADAGTAAAIAAPAKPSVTAPTTTRLLSLVARWPSHPDFSVRVMGGLESIVSLPLVGAHRGGAPVGCPPLCGTGPDRHPAAGQALGAAGCRRGTPVRRAHVRIWRNHRATLSERSTVPPTAHAAPATTTASRTQRTAPTGCRPVLAAASCARGSVMPGETGWLSAGASWPDALEPPLPPDVVAPDPVLPVVAPDVPPDGEVDELASAWSCLTTSMAWALRLAPTEPAAENGR